MKVNREKLLASLEAVLPGVSSREVVEQSCCIVFRGGRAFSFNDELFCSVKSPIEIEGAVKAKPLLELLHKLPEEELEIEVSEGKVKIQGDRRKSSINMESKVTLPVECIETPAKWRKLSEGFLEAFKIVGDCCGQDQSRFVLTCVHIDPEWIEACDRYQLCRYFMDTGIKESVLVRQVAMKSVVDTDVVEFSLTDGWLHFRNPKGLQFSCRRYPNKYPSLEGFLDVKGSKTSLPKDIEAEIAKASIFSQAMVTVELRPGKMRITGRGADGWFKRTDDVEYKGAELGFHVAPRLLLEIVRRGEKMIIGDGRLKVTTDKWSYVSCTAVNTEADAKEGD